MNHKYWGRAKIEDYNIIACDIISEKKYGNERLPVLMIAKDGKILEDDQSKTRIYRGDTYYHEITGISVEIYTTRKKSGDLHH